MYISTLYQIPTLPSTVLYMYSSARPWTWPSECKWSLDLFLVWRPLPPHGALRVKVWRGWDRASVCIIFWSQQIGAICGNWYINRIYHVQKGHWKNVIFRFVLYQEKAKTTTQKHEIKSTTSNKKKQRMLEVRRKLGSAKQNWNAI